MNNGQVLVCGAKLKGVFGVKLSKQRREQRAKQPCTIITFVPEGMSASEFYSENNVNAPVTVDTGGEKRKEPARSYLD